METNIIKNSYYVWKFLMVTYICSLIGSFTACSDGFLDKMPEGNYVDNTYYESDAALLAASAVLYNRPWFEYNSDPVLGISQLCNDTFSPWGDPQYNTFQVTGIDSKLQNMWKSLYSVVTMSNNVIYACNNKASEGCSDSIKVRCIAEARLMRAQAYFYMVRLWGPCILWENNLDVVETPVRPRNTEADVFKFIIRDLRYARQNLPASWQKGRATKWTADAILAKVYLARSGWNGGERNINDLDSCKYYCRDIFENSGLNLLKDYTDLFKYKFNNNEESLLAMQWVPLGEWGTQNTLYNALNINEVSGGIGVWGSPFAAIDMLEQYEQADTIRRNATFFTQNAYYSYLNISEGGFTYTRTQTNTKKGAVGGPNDNNDGKVASMNSPLNTYILRLADTYLTYAEACLGNNSELSSGDDGWEYYNLVRDRAKIGRKSSITLDDIIRERRVEFCMEFCNWYDMVSWFKWKPEKMLAYFNQQKRGLRYDRITKDAYSILHYEGPIQIPYTDVTADHIMLPYPENEVIRNHYLKETPQPY